MSNYSEGTQVPFGDGSHVPHEERSACDFQTDTSLQNAMKNIFIACDPNNSNLAQVSELINIMIPHMEDRTADLTVLKIALDPNGINPHVDSQTFYNAMIQWASQFMEDLPETDNEHSTAEESTKVKAKGLEGSSSKTSIGHHFLKGYIESDGMNVSNSSIYSGTGNSGIDVLDVTILQEKINELEHQNRKLSEDLDHSRTQLTNSEEQIEILQADVRRITRRLFTEQQTNAQLEKEKHNHEELIEASTAAQKQINKLEKDLASAEKEISKLKQHNHNLEVENQKFEDKIDQLVKRETESKKTIIKLQTEVIMKEQEVVSLEDLNIQKDAKLKEQTQLVSHYSNVNKSLTDEKLKMEQQYRDVMKSQILTGHLERVSQTFSVAPSPPSNPSSGNFKNPSILNPVKESFNPPQDNYASTVNTSPMLTERQFHSPLAKLYKNKGFIYNSPRLLSMVANPVSPCLDNSTVASSAICKKSVDSDGSPLLLCGKQEANSVFLYTSSTPEASKKTLLDQTPPSVVRKLPLLPPTYSSPTRRKSKSPTIKRDFALFRQYRFVGHLSSDEELDYETGELPEGNLPCTSQIKQQYDSNLNIISHLEELREPSLLNEDEKKEGTLPTMYVVERSLGKQRSKSASCDSPSSLKNIADLSGEEVPLLWKLSRVSPHESLESEISQAKLVDNEIAELKNTIHNLVKENSHLKSLTAGAKLWTCSPEKREHYSDMEFKAINTRVEELESDNNRKYIKIIDLMEEKEKLQKELKRVSEKDSEEINKLKQNLFELHHEKCRILRELQQEKSGRHSLDAVMAHLQSTKRECDLLQNLLGHSRKNGEDLSKELDKISIEKWELKTKVDQLKNTICKANEKNTELNFQLLSLNNEYLKLKKSVYVRAAEEANLLKISDNANLEVSKLTKENEESAYQPNSHAFAETCSENSKGLYLPLEEIQALKNVTAEHSSLIESFKKEITDLSATNSRLSQNITEKENQITALKQIIAHQNESLKEVTCDKETSTTRLYEQKCENDKLFESNKELARNNKELAKNNNELMKQLEHLQTEKEYLGVRLENLEEENSNILAEFKIIAEDYKNVKNSDNQLLKEYKLLVAEKELLMKNNEQLTNDHEKIMELKERIEKQLLDVQNEIISLSNLKHNYSPSKPTKVASPRRQTTEAQDHDQFRDRLSTIRGKIVQLEYNNEQLQLENEKLQEDFTGIRSNYEALLSEQEMWLVEKNKWEQTKEELTKKLKTAALAESQLLEEQLSNNSKSSVESIQTSESSCKNCLTLQSEKEELAKRLNELLQEQNSKKNQGRKYDRMETIIEKLRSKGYETELQLKNEQEKTAELEKENTKLKLEVQNSSKNYHKENSLLEKENSRLLKEVEENLNKFKMEKVDMAAKHSKLKEQLKKSQKDIQELGQEKGFVLQDYNNLKEKLDELVKEKENRVKSINKETNQLKQEIQELVKQKTKLEKKLATTENLLKCKPNADKINKENAQLKQDMQEHEKKLTKAEQDLKEKLLSEQKLRDHQESLVKEISKMKEQVEDLEKKLEKSQLELQNSEAKNLCIQKELVDTHHVESDNVEMRSCEGGNVEAVEEENDSLKKLLKNYENELVELKIKLNDTSNSLHSLSKYVEDIRQNLNEKRQRLKRSTFTAVSNWRTTLEKAPDQQLLLNIFDKGEPGVSEKMFIGPLDEEMFKFKHQIRVASLILDAIGRLQTPGLIITSRTDVAVQVLPSSFSPRRFKKFDSTKSGSSRSASPESPCLESSSLKGKSRSTNTRAPRSRDVSSSAVQSRPASPKNDVKFCSVGTSTVVKLQNTDISPLRSNRASAIPVRSRETSPANKSSNYVDSDGKCRCFIGTNVVCYQLPQDDDTEDSMPSDDEEVEVELNTNRSSPTLSGSTLEGLGLLSEVDSPSWSKKEIEEKFHILVTCFMMDVVTIKERYQKHQTRQTRIEDRFFLESEKVVATLRNIKRLGRDQQMKVLVTTCLRQVKHIIGMSSQISILATQCGALQHEQHSLKVINVMINHAANLRQVVENASPRLKSIGSSKSSPRHRRSGDTLVHKSSGSSLYSNVSSICKLNNDESQELPKLDLNESDDRNDLKGHIFALVPPKLSEEVNQPKKEPSESGFVQVSKRLVLALLLILTVIAVVFIICVCTSNESSVHGYPWHWVTWNDLFTPFIQLTYPEGPPPT